MSSTTVGHCPKCGAPIYSPGEWWGVLPPPPQYTCFCYNGGYTITANTSGV